MITFPPKKILVAYDLSDVSRAAWKHAAALAASCGASLEAVYVEAWRRDVDLMPLPDLIPADITTLRARIRTAIGDGPKITILQGDPAARVLSLARRRRPDMIVVGTHGRKGLKLALLGSVAEAVIRGASVPVLVARGPVRPIRAILAPVNFAPYSDRGFGYAASAAAALASRLTALHVTGDPIWDGNPRYRLSNLIHRLPPEIRKRCQPMAEEGIGDALNVILKASRKHDWVVLVAHRKSLVKDVLFGTTLEQVLRRSSIPVLSVPASNIPYSAPRVAVRRSTAAASHG